MEYNMEEIKHIKITPARLVFLRELRNGPRTWKDLKAAYFGPDRGQSKSHNSFQQQKNKLRDKLGIIKEEDGHLELTDKGRALLSICSEEALANAKSEAQLRFEQNKQTEGVDAQEAN